MTETNQNSKPKQSSSKRKRLGKDLTVDTSFLPDDGKDDRDMELRKTLRIEWLENQKKLKNQTLDFEYVFWDGSPESFHFITLSIFHSNRIQLWNLESIKES